MSSEALAVESVRILDGAGGARTVDAAGLARWKPEDGALWIDVDLNKDAAKAWVRQESGIDAMAAETLLAVETRPRAVNMPDGLLIVVRGVNLNPGADPEDMVATRIWLDRRRIVTSRRRRVLSVEDIAEALAEGKGPSSVGDFLVFLIARLTDRIGSTVEQIEDEIDDIELRIADDNISTLREGLGDLRRQIASIRRFLSPQRDALDRLYRHPGDFLSDHESQEMREETDRLTRYLEDLDLARERALVTQEELLNRVAQEQNQRVYLLSIIAAIFLPLTFVTGLLGMNVAGLPGTEAQSAFNIAVVAMVLLGVGLTVFFKWKKWI